MSIPTGYVGWILVIQLCSSTACGIIDVKPMPSFEACMSERSILIIPMPDQTYECYYRTKAKS